MPSGCVDRTLTHVQCDRTIPDTGCPTRPSPAGSRGARDLARPTYGMPGLLTDVLTLSLKNKIYSRENLQEISEHNNIMCWHQLVVEVISGTRTAKRRTLVLEPALERYDMPGWRTSYPAVHEFQKTVFLT